MFEYLLDDKILEKMNAEYNKKLKCDSIPCCNLIFIEKREELILDLNKKIATNLVGFCLKFKELKFKNELCHILKIKGLKTPANIDKNRANLDNLLTAIELQKQIIYEYVALNKNKILSSENYVLILMEEMLNIYLFKKKL